MNLRLITQQDLKRHYPMGLRSYTTEEYARFANLLYRKLMEEEIDILSPQDMREIAITLTLYYEDVLADAGIFRAFTDKMKEMYGRYLPFYDVETTEYYRDEPNICDVAFLIWNYLIQILDDRILNPENPGLKSLATDVYELMDEWFEKMPINEELKNFFTDADFMEDFYLLRDVEQWLLFECYLTCDIDMYDIAREQMDSCFGLIPTMSESQMAHYVICHFTTSRKIGPLALYSQEWLAAILRANGKEKEAEEVEQIECRKMQIYHSECRGDGYVLRDYAGKELFLTAFNMGVKGKAETSPFVIGEFVRYKGEWHNNGITSWTKNDVKMSDEEMRAIKEDDLDTDPTFEKLVKKNGGSRLFYFKDVDDMWKFHKIAMEREVRPEERVDVPQHMHHRPWTIFIPEKGSRFFSSVDIASCICDPCNPFYDEKKAHEEAFNMAFNIPVELLRYLIEHHYLPDARLASVYGEERGRQLLQDNFDFVARARYRSEY